MRKSRKNFSVISNHLSSRNVDDHPICCPVCSHTLLGFPNADRHTQTVHPIASREGATGNQLHAVAYSTGIHSRELQLDVTGKKEARDVLWEEVEAAGGTTHCITECFLRFRPRRNVGVLLLIFIPLDLQQKHYHKLVLQAPEAKYNGSYNIIVNSLHPQHQLYVLFFRG